MSTYWDVWCLDCEVGCGLRETWGEGLLMLVNFRRQIAELAPSRLRVDTGETGLRTQVVEPQWFALHKHHRLVPRSEYGDIFGRCERWALCNAGHSHPCVLDAGHVGPCSAVAGPPLARPS